MTTGQILMRSRPVDEPTEDRVPAIEDPFPEIPVVDPRRRDAPEPVREPERSPDSDPVPE